MAGMKLRQQFSLLLLFGVLALLCVFLERVAAPMRQAASEQANRNQVHQSLKLPR
jgi:hypothetical protein